MKRAGLIITLAAGLVVQTLSAQQPASQAPPVFKSSVNQQLVSALNLVAGQGALESQLAAGGLDPRVVQARVAQAKAQVSSLEPQPAEQTAREFIGFGVAIILYVALVVYGHETPLIGGITSSHPIMTDPDLDGWRPAPQVLGGVLRVECRRLKEK